MKLPIHTLILRVLPVAAMFSWLLIDKSHVTTNLQQSGNTETQIFYTSFTYLVYITTILTGVLLSANAINNLKKAKQENKKNYTPIQAKEFSVTPGLTRELVQEASFSVN